MNLTSKLTVFIVAVLGAVSCTTTPMPQSDPIKINLDNVNGFKTHLPTIKDNPHVSYDAIVVKHIGVDLEGLKVLVDWCDYDKKSDKLTTNWGDYGIYTENPEQAWTFDNWDKAGRPTIKINPETSRWPLAATKQDSTLFNNPNIQIKLASPIYINSIESLWFQITQMKTMDTPFIVEFTGTLALGNSDISVVSDLFTVLSKPGVSKLGQIQLMANTDSTRVDRQFLTKLEGLGGLVVQNENNAFYAAGITSTDATLLAGIAQNQNVIFRTNKYADGRAGSNYKLYPDTLYIRQERHDLSELVDNLMNRPTDWRFKKYFLDAGNTILDVPNTPFTLKRVAPPKSHFANEYDYSVLPVANLSYGNIYLDAEITTLELSEKDIALLSRIHGSPIQTVIRSWLNYSNNWDITMRYYPMGPNNEVQRSIPGVGVKNLTLIHLDALTPVRFGSAYSIDPNYQPTIITLDAHQHYIVLPEGFELLAVTHPSHEFQNDFTVLKYIFDKYNIDLKNRIVDQSGYGTLPNGKSFYWITWSEYLALVSQGKVARGAPSQTPEA